MRRNKESNFVNLGSVKASKGLGDKVTANLRGSELGMNIKLYMPGTKLIVSNGSSIDLRFGNRDSDADFVVGHASMYLGNMAMKKGTSEEDIEGLQDLGGKRDMSYDLRLEIYLGKDDSSELELRDGDLIHVNFKPYKDSPKFVVASASLVTE